MMFVWQPLKISSGYNMLLNVSLQNICFSIKFVDMSMLWQKAEKLETGPDFKMNCLYKFYYRGTRSQHHF